MFGIFSGAANWLDDLTQEERAKLYEAVGFVENGEHEANPEVRI